MDNDMRSVEFIAELKRLNQAFSGQTGDYIMDGLRKENLHRCPGCPFLATCQAECTERSPLTQAEKARIEQYRADAYLSA